MKRSARARSRRARGADAAAALVIGPRIVRCARFASGRRAHAAASTSRARSQDALDGARRAAALVFVPHTTAGLTINEHADPAVARDFEAALERIVGDDWGWEHIEDPEAERALARPRGADGAAGRHPARRRPARARHLAGDLLLRVRRAARPHGLRDARCVDRGRGAHASASGRRRPSPISASASSRGRSPASSGRTARARRRRCARCSGSSTRTRARATVLGQPYRELDRPLDRVGAVLEASEVPPGPLGPEPPARARRGGRLPRSRVDEVLALVELTAAAKRRVGRLLARDAAAARARAARCSATRECSSSTSRPTASTRRASAGCATSCARSPTRPDDPGLEPRALRGRADRRQRRDHPPRPARHAGAVARCSRGVAGGDARAQPGRATGCASCSRAAGRDATTLDADGSLVATRRRRASARSPRRTASSCTS